MENKEFKSTFKKLEKMTKGERAAFDQGCFTAKKNIKERLGLAKPRE